MSVRRAPSSFLTSLAAFITANPTNAAVNVSMVAINAVSQLYASTGSLVNTPATVAAAINPGAQTITMPGGGVPAWIEIPSNALRAILGGNVASLPSEPLQLSTEAAANFTGGWDAVFAGLGWNTFTPTAPVPSMTC